MKTINTKSFFFFLFFSVLVPKVYAHKFTFCGEPIPVDKEFVANKLMNVIRRQMPYANMAFLRQRALKYFPFIEEYLRKNGIPEDFKYIPIVESGFANLSSSAGARGFWQLMPAVARDFNLKVNTEVDERDDPEKATQAACKLILLNYKLIQKNISLPSWVLTAAAYNFGIGNILKTARKQGTDYFTMNLNAETAEYVYKIIAIKELFENPELYMSGFGSNIFRSDQPSSTTTTQVTSRTNPVPDNTPAIQGDFSSLNLTISKSPAKVREKPARTAFVPAHLVKSIKNFQDGDLVPIELDKDLELHGAFTRKGNIIKGAGWIIDGRVFVDLGYGHDVQVLDVNAIKGIPLADIADGKQYMLLKTEIYND